MNEIGAKKSKFLKFTQQMACTQKICHEISMKKHCETYYTTITSNLYTNISTMWLTHLDNSVPKSSMPWVKSFPSLPH